MIRTILLLFLGVTNYLFAYQGQGEGTTRQEAINIALNSVASQISTIVSSKLKITKESNSQGYNRDVEQVIYADINDIAFNNYEIIEEKRDKKKYLIILKVDEKRLADGYASRIGQKLKQIATELEQDSIFKCYLILKKYSFSDLFSQTYIMWSIDSTSPYKEKYIEEINRLSRLKVEYQQKLVFQVTSSDSDIKNIANSILNQALLMTSDFGKLKFNITLSPLTITKIYKQFSATSRATIEIIENSHTVYSKTLRLSATSYVTEYLKEEILKRLESELKKSLEILK
jgi:hypothetical protein